MKPHLGIAYRSLILTVAATVTALACPVAAQTPAVRGTVQGEFINFETPLIKPVLVTSDGQHIIAVNEPDGRLSVLDASSLALIAEPRVGLGLAAVAERPGGAEIWVSAMHSSAVMVLDTATWEITHLLRAPIDTPADGLGDSATPGMIEFSADGSKAWVTATSTDALLVFDAVSKQHLKTVPLAVFHNGRSTRIKEPRTIVRIGDQIHVVPFKSGNQTAVAPDALIGLSPNIADLDRVDGMSLPDADVLTLSAIDETVLAHQKAVGTLLYGIAANPVTGDLVIANMESQNRLVGEGAFPEGRITHNRLTYLAPGDAPGDYAYVALDDLDDGGDTIHLAMPTDVVVDGTGRVFVAAYASSRIGVFDSAGSFLGAIPTDAGPRGLALSPAGDRLVSLNRIAGTVSVYDVSAGVPGGALLSAPVGAYDPTWDQVIAGRGLFHDAENSSGAGTSGCFSCHADLQEDGLAWELSAFHDTGDGYTRDNPPLFWKDRKFAMTTQDSRSLEDSAPYHWRGEQKDLDDFNNAFPGLQKRAGKLPPEDFGLIKSYTFATVYPANPHQRLDRAMSEDAARGFELFKFADPTGGTCNDCHTMPSGTRGAITSDLEIGKLGRGGGRVKTVEPSQLKGMWIKESDSANVAESGPEILVPVTGFGFNHTGTNASIANFIRDTFPGVPADQQDLVIAFLRELDSGIAPAANYSLLLNAETALTFGGSILIDQANFRACDIVGFGRVNFGGGFQSVGMFFDRQSQAFVFDDSSVAPRPLDQLVALAASGNADVLLLGAPLWSGERIGIDRDRDAVRDGDEIKAGLDPANPDTDGDGFWDSYDDEPLVPNVTVSHTEAPVVTGWEIQHVNANSARLAYTTDTFSPTRVVYGKTQAYGQAVGDEIPLASDSNRWKRAHSITLRTMDDGTLYHFQIETEGQNGVVGGSGDLTVETLSDAIDGIPHTLHVADLTLTVDQVGANSEFTATITVVTNQNEPVPDAVVNGVWTVFVGGEPGLQLDGTSAPTDANGITTVTLSTDQLQSGDSMNFMVPMFRGDLGSEIPGIVDTVVLDRPFAWPDSVLTSASVELP